jgi:GNAT superfamily N-acetyltransferase
MRGGWWSEELPHARSRLLGRTGHPGGVEKDRPTDADTPRRAGRDEARAVADLWLRSRKASVPANPATIHDDDEVREHFETVVLPEQEVWVIDRDGLGIVGMMALKVGSVEDLHVDPDWTGRGLGSVLIDLAKERCPAGLELWTFQSNTGARRFYERHGFTVVAMTDDENEEKAPDLLYRWSP